MVKSPKPNIQQVPIDVLGSFINLHFSTIWNLIWSRSLYINRHVDEALTSWFLIIQHHLNRHATLKTRRVKSKRLPEWLTPDILNACRMRDTFKRAKNWQEYKKFRNVTRDLIRKAKKKHFSESIASQKDTKNIRKHFRSFNKNVLPKTHCLKNL